MKIKETIKIDSPANDIWGILRDPGNMPAWNPKCCYSSGNSGIVVGSSFEARFELGGKSKITLCEVIELKPCEKITIRYSGGAFSSGDGYVDETFSLFYQRPRQTKIRLEVDFSKSELPFFVKWPMWFVSAFGYKAGRSSLDGIKDLLE